MTQSKFKKRQKVWLLQPGKDKVPAIIKDIIDNVYHVYVYYNGFWHDDVVNVNFLEARTDDISRQLYELRKHLLDKNE